MNEMPDDNSSTDDASAGQAVTIVEADPTWTDRYVQAASELRAALGDRIVAMEHIGSTAVPGLAAKPVIDIQLGVRSLRDDGELVAAIESIGYRYRPDLEAGFANRRFFQREGDDVRLVNLHVAERTDVDWWDRHLAFRDWLRTHPDDREAYAGLKHDLAARHRHDRVAYTEAKSAFIDVIVGRALAAGTDSTEP
ncbi:MAG: GrpB family protein [Acidimicrobiales bacterium]